MFFSAVFALIAPLAVSAASVPPPNIDAVFVGSKAIRAQAASSPLCIGSTSINIGPDGGPIGIFNCRQPACYHPGCQYSSFNNSTLVFEPITPGENKLKLIYYRENLCLESGFNAAGDAVPVAAPCVEGEPKQSWWLTDDAHIAQTGSGKCLDVKDGALNDNGLLQLWDCVGGNANQLFETYDYENLPVRTGFWN